MGVEILPMKIEQIVDIKFDEPRPMRLKQYNRDEQPIQVERIRVKWQWREDTWQIDGATAWYRKIKTNGEPYLNIQWDFWTPQQFLAALPDVARDSIPKHTITITEARA